MTENFPRALMVHSLGGQLVVYIGEVLLIARPRPPGPLPVSQAGASAAGRPRPGSDSPARRSATISVEKRQFLPCFFGAIRPGSSLLGSGSILCDFPFFFPGGQPEFGPSPSSSRRPYGPQSWGTARRIYRGGVVAVSYTHLTLPTIYSV